MNVKTVGRTFSPKIRDGDIVSGLGGNHIDTKLVELSRIQANYFSGIINGSKHFKAYLKPLVQVLLLLLLRLG